MRRCHVGQLEFYSHFELIFVLFWFLVFGFHSPSTFLSNWWTCFWLRGEILFHFVVVWGCGGYGGKGCLFICMHVDVSVHNYCVLPRYTADRRHIKNRFSNLCWRLVTYKLWCICRCHFFVISSNGAILFSHVNSLRSYVTFLSALSEHLLPVGVY